MTLIIIDGPNGIRKVPEKEEFRLQPGEQVIGSEPENGDVTLRSSKLWVIDKLASYFGIASADLIFFAAKAFGIPHCSVCEMRYKILHIIDKIGVRKAVKLIGKTIMGQEVSEEDARLVEESFQEVQPKS